MPPSKELLPSCSPFALVTEIVISIKTTLAKIFCPWIYLNTSLPVSEHRNYLLTIVVEFICYL